MSNYKQMYCKLFNAVTDSLEKLRQNDLNIAVSMLVKAQQECEELFMSREKWAKK